MLAIAEDDEDEDLRLLEVVKTNLSKKGLTRQYRVHRQEVKGLQELVPRLIPTKVASDKSVNDLLKMFRRKERVPFS